MKLPARICMLTRLGCIVTANAMKEYGEAVHQYVSAKCGFVRPNTLRSNLGCGLSGAGLPLAAFSSDYEDLAELSNVPPRAELKTTSLRPDVGGSSGA